MEPASQKETSPLDLLRNQFTASQKLRFCSPMRNIWGNDVYQFDGTSIAKRNIPS